MKIWDNKTSQVYFDNIHAFIIAVMSNIIVEVNGYGAIVANDKSEDNVYIVSFTYILCTLQ